MKPSLMKYGIRVEGYSKSLGFGIGATWYTERALTIEFLFWSIHVGKVYA